jgi:hypothetical protein
MFKGRATSTSTIFVKSTKYERYERLNIQIHITLYGDKSWTVAFIVTQKKVGAVNDHGRNYKFYLNQFLFDKTFKRGDGVNF